MKHEFRLADIGEGLEEAEVIAWRVQIGDVVQRDQPIVEVMTDKSNADLPAPWSGTIVSLGASVGDMMTVGDLVAVIDDGATSTVSPSSDSGAFETAVQAAPSPSATFAQATAPGPALNTAPSSSTLSLDPETNGHDREPVSIPLQRRAKASPTTRREAAKRGIDITQLVGSGPGGRILLADLDRVAASGATAPEPQRPADQAPSFAPTLAPALDLRTAAVATEPTRQTAQGQPVTRPAGDPPVIAPGVQPLRGVRRLIARNMTKSWQEVPHIHTWREIDAEPLMALRARLRDSGRDDYQTLTPLAFFVAAVAQGLRRFPIVNSSLDFSAETITTHSDVNVGIAVASPNGLVVPVITNADQLSLVDTAHTIADLVSRARSGDLGSDAFKGGTATITNFGSLGGESAAPILRPPESAIVGFGSIAARPYVIDSTVVARQTMNVVVGADHRLLDGDITTAFLNDVCGRLIDPIDLALGL